MIDDRRTTGRTEFAYVGDELELFAEATNWKTYWAKATAPYVHGDVVEVGAGLGASTRYACNASVKTWLCLEPDAKHVAYIEEEIASGGLPGICRAACGSLADLDPGRRFDTILYVDVLEHIRDDEAEIRQAAELLRSGGRIVVLSPAFQFLYSPFDQAIGHFRRYVLGDAQRFRVPHLALETAFYLDSIGFFASLANKALLRASRPTSAQIRLWDQRMVPISIIADRLFYRMFGRSVVLIWRKT